MVKNGNELLMNHYGYSGRPTQDKKIKIQLKLGLIKKTEKNVYVIIRTINSRILLVVVVIINLV